MYVVAVKRSTASQLPVVTKTSASSTGSRQSQRPSTSSCRSVRSDTTTTNSTVGRARAAPRAAPTVTTATTGTAGAVGNSRDARGHNASMLDKLKLLGSKNKTSTSAEVGTARNKSSTQLPLSSARQNTTTSNSSSSSTSSGAAGRLTIATTTNLASGTSRYNTSSSGPGTARHAGDRRSRSDHGEALSMETSDVKRVSVSKPRASRPTAASAAATCISDVKSSTSYNRTALTTSSSTFKATAIPTPSQRSSAGVRPITSRLAAPVTTASKLQSSSSSARQSAGLTSSRRVTDVEDQTKSRAQRTAKQTGAKRSPTHTTPVQGAASRRGSSSTTARPAPAVSARTSSLTNQSTSSSSAAPNSSTADRRDVMTSSQMTSKPQKVSSDTQTTASAVQSAHIRRQLSEMAARSAASHDVGGKVSSRSSKVKRQTDMRDESSGSLNSDSTASEEAGKSSSNSNNSASSVDSVVCRPTSSCDERDNDKSSSRRSTTDHIASLRSKKHDDVASSQSANVTDLKPMPPIVRSAYLRTTGAADVITTSSRARDLGSAVSRLGVHRPLVNQHEPGSGYKHWARDTGLHDSLDSVGAGATGAGAGGGGYMSDGDIVRTACRQLTGDDANCGYMSEGGVSLYMKRMQQRFREGMLAVRESMEKNNGQTDDDRYRLDMIMSVTVSVSVSTCQRHP